MPVWQLFKPKLANSASLWRFFRYAKSDSGYSLLANEERGQFRKEPICHCEEQSDEAISFLIYNIKMPKTYFVYILTNKAKTVLYTGVTNDLDRRLIEHRSGKEKTFTTRYNVNILVYFETTEDVNSAITREKQIKGGSRQDKIDLINQLNPEWKDLSKER